METKLDYGLWIKGREAKIGSELWFNEGDGRNKVTIDKILIYQYQSPQVRLKNEKNKYTFFRIDDLEFISKCLFWEKPIIYQLPDTEGNLTEVKVGQKIYDNTLFKPLRITCLCLWNNIIIFRDDKGAIGGFNANINNLMRVPRYTTNRPKRDFRPYFDFNQAPNGYDYGVISRSGHAKWCTKKPLASENLNLWVSSDSVISAGYRQNLINPETGLVDDWEDSLVERPKDVK